MFLPLILERGFLTVDFVNESRLQIHILCEIKAYNKSMR